MKRLKYFAFLVALFLLSTVPANINGHVQAAAAPLLAQGSYSGDVWDLQFRLKTLGYIEQADGQYGKATEAAVYRFQQHYGLTMIDGIVGPETWSALKKHTLSKGEMDIMAKTIYSEARGESYKGQVAVGAVVMNRIQSNQFPDTIRGVVFESGAFTAVDDGQYWLTPDSSAYRAAQDAVRGWDPSYNSLYYFNPDTATSSWIWTRPQTVQIGNHIFAK
jgi:N-acetylmuramoyl-L-alanine amidase